MAQSYAGFVCFLTWTSNTLARPPSKRAVALAFINAFSQLGNIAGSWVSHVVLRHRGWLTRVLSPGQVCVAKVLGSFIFPLLRDLHFGASALHRDVHRLQTSSFPGEQAPGAARDFIGQIGRSRIQISSVGSICQSVTIMREYSESKYEAASSVRGHVIACQCPVVCCQNTNTSRLAAICSGENGPTGQFWCAFESM